MLNTPNTALPWYDVCLELLLLDFNIFYIKCELYTTTRALEYTTCSVSLLTQAICCSESGPVTEMERKRMNKAQNQMRYCPSQTSITLYPH